MADEIIDATCVDPLALNLGRANEVDDCDEARDNPFNLLEWRSGRDS